MSTENVGDFFHVILGTPVIDLTLFGGNEYIFNNFFFF